MEEHRVGSVTVRESGLPVAGATEQSGLPTVQKGVDTNGGGALLCPLPRCPVSICTFGLINILHL